MSDSATTLRGINGKLYRLLALQAAHVPGLDVEAATESLADELNTLSGKLSGYRDSQSEGTQAALNRVLAELTQYRDTVLVVGSMLDLDFLSAVELVRPFDQNAERMLAAFGAVAARAVGSARAGQSLRADRHPRDADLPCVGDVRGDHAVACWPPHRQRNDRLGP